MEPCGGVARLCRRLAGSKLVVVNGGRTRLGEGEVGEEAGVKPFKKVAAGVMTGMVGGGWWPSVLMEIK